MKDLLCSEKVIFPFILTILFCLHFSLRLKFILIKKHILTERSIYCMGAVQIFEIRNSRQVSSQKTYFEYLLAIKLLLPLVNKLLLPAIDHHSPLLSITA